MTATRLPTSTEAIPADARREKALNAVTEPSVPPTVAAVSSMEAHMAEERPEALAEFAETARKQQHQKETVQKPLTADEHTTPVPEDNKAKHEAATRLLEEGATGEKDGGGAGEEALRMTRDRVRGSR